MLSVKRPDGLDGMKSGGRSQAEALKGLIGWAAGGRLRQLSIILHQWCRRRGGSVTTGAGVDHLWHVHVCSTWRIIDFFHKVFKICIFLHDLMPTVCLKPLFSYIPPCCISYSFIRWLFVFQDLKMFLFFSPIRAWGCLLCFLLNCQKWTQIRPR